ncbi:sensor histidine kinase [Nonomuraea aurantiaca]|uniref:sensor histidine kinase n=1 Tax=Nonomuraea aurantiaca TaxID=2878562 RepID=UPI001CD95632|nr:HAMP domain-containing sensor histidine kinase [Nonomuraea aurantiaca]MCA2229060.1 HAMP domain-containing histidine kinase [Nonomuraea aurantiaca]
MTWWRDLLTSGRPSVGLASVRLRATAAATLVVAVALGLAAVVLVLALRGSLQSSAGAEAARKAVAAAPYAQTVDLTAALGQTATVQAATPGEPTAAEWARTSGDPVAGVSVQPALALRIADSDVMLTREGAPAATSWAQGGGFAVARMPVSTSSGSAEIWARASLDGADQALTTLNSALLPGVPALLLVVAGMTWFSVGRTLAPVAAIRAKVADITARDLHQRVPVPRSGDEIAALATTVNGTLDRLETAVETHKRFVADAAHELRSPIATLRARLELAEPSELTAEALADVERLQSLAADLLLLAKLDAGEPLRTGDLDLGQVAAEESLRIKRRPELRMELDVEPDVVFQGSRAHLARLVTNLVDNAVRHAAAVVRVRVRQEDGQAVLQVLDDGPGIPVGQREAVFDRFTRLDEARARDVGGAGLGLPIARDIALLHGGMLLAEEGGFIARFPLNH